MYEVKLIPSTMLKLGAK